MYKCHFRKLSNTTLEPRTIENIYQRKATVSTVFPTCTFPPLPRDMQWPLAKMLPRNRSHQSIGRDHPYPTESDCFYHVAFGPPRCIRIPWRRGTVEKGRGRCESGSEVYDLTVWGAQTPRRSLQATILTEKIIDPTAMKYYQRRSKTSAMVRIVGCYFRVLLKMRHAEQGGDTH